MAQTKWEYMHYAVIGGGPKDVWFQGLVETPSPAEEDMILRLILEDARKIAPVHGYVLPSPEDAVLKTFVYTEIPYLSPEDSTEGQ